MFDAYLVDLLALKEVVTDRLTDGRTFAFLELLPQLKTTFSQTPKLPNCPHVSTTMEWGHSWTP